MFPTASSERICNSLKRAGMAASHAAKFLRNIRTSTPFTRTRRRGRLLCCAAPMPPRVRPRATRSGSHLTPAVADPGSRPTRRLPGGPACHRNSYRYLPISLLRRPASRRPDWFIRRFGDTPMWNAEPVAAIRGPRTHFPTTPFFCRYGKYVSNTGCIRRDPFGLAGWTALWALAGCAWHSRCRFNLAWTPLLHKERF
jgi:hypothetical protein